MIINYRQIRAARALLDWSQTDLAEAADIATSSIKNIESDASSARRETIAQIHDAFVSNGIEFLPHSGVRLKTDVVDVFEGRAATPALLDSIFQNASASQMPEVCIIGLDESFSVETDGAVLLAQHIERLKRAGIRERILICEGDRHFLNDKDSYRWLPKNYFTRSAPIYIYGDKVAVHTGSLRRKTIIIEARAFAQHLRSLFELLWDKASQDPEITKSYASPTRLGAGR